MYAARASTRHTFQDVRFWLWWVGMTTLGWVIGWWVGFIAGSLLMSSPLTLLGLSGGYLIVSAAVGLMQWWVLSIHYPSPAHRWRWWAPAGIAGSGLSLVPFALICGAPLYGLQWLPVVALGGALVGLLQQRILRQFATHSWWWVPACAGGWALTIASSFVSTSLLRSVDIGPAVFFLDWALQGLALGLITGSVLVLLPAQPAQPPAAPVVTGREINSAWFWIAWTGLTTLGWLIGSLYSVLGWPLSNAMAVVSVSAGVGLMQWQLLRLTQASPAHRWRWWVPAAIAGMALPGVLSTVIWGASQLDLRWVALMGLGGALVGFLQQRILRRWLAQSWWWVLASALGWALGTLVHALLVSSVWPAWAPAPAYALPLMWALSGLPLAVATASAIVWLLRQPALPASPRST